MWYYTLLLVALTVLPVCFGVFGLIYLASAVVLGALMIIGVWKVRMVRDGAWEKPAWWVFSYSLLYLALLFVAMAADRHL